MSRTKKLDPMMLDRVARVCAERILAYTWAVARNPASLPVALNCGIGSSSTKQIALFCYATSKTLAARASAISRDTAELIKQKRLKVQIVKSGKFRGSVYCTRDCSPTDHSLEIRELLVKIIRSEWDIRELLIQPALGALTPDLFVEFEGETKSIRNHFCWQLVFCLPVHR